VKDSGENLGGYKGNWSHGVAQGVEELYYGIYFLISRGNGRNACPGIMNDRLEVIKSGFDAGECIGEHGCLRVTLQDKSLKNRQK
jgi:hypothetical protein